MGTDKAQDRMNERDEEEISTSQRAKSSVLRYQLTYRDVPTLMDGTPPGVQCYF
jgi:hypothetical protein